MGSRRRVLVAWGSVQIFIKIIALLVLCAAVASCSEEDRFGIGLERPEDAGLTEFQKKQLRNLRAESAEEMKERLKNAIFYRVTADYAHIDRKSGELEEVSFDFVAMCGDRVLMDKEGYTISEDDGNVNPAHFFKQTADGGLIAMRVPSACRSHQFIKKVPNNLTPFVVWYNDVHNIGFGLGYATESAYQSPVSQLKFYGASLIQTNYDDWLKWRKKQLTQFKPIGFVQGPWGISLSGNEPERVGNNSKVSRLTNLSFCSGQQRIRVSPEYQEAIRNYWPNSKTGMKFWWEEDVGIEAYTIAKAFDRIPNYIVNPLWANTSFNYSYGIKTKLGNSQLYEESEQIKNTGNIYPKFESRRLPSPNEKIRFTKLLEYIDYRSEMLGFVACGTMVYGHDVNVRSLGHLKGAGLYVNNDLIWRKNSEHLFTGFPVKYFFENDTYIWTEVF